MALANYSDLTAALSSWLNRTDLTGTYDTFIALFEARANRALRTPQMEASSTALPTSNALALPSDFMEAREVYLSGKYIHGMSPMEMRDTKTRFTSGDPIGYAIVAQTLVFAPPIADTTTVYLNYYQKIPTLTSTNWLMTAYPDAYLYGTLAAAYDYLRDDTQRDAMLSASDRIFAEIQRDASRRRLPAGPLVARNSVYYNG